MTPRCRDPLPSDVLVEYWAGALAADETERVDEHLMGCATCTGASGRIGAIASAVRDLIPPILRRDEVVHLRGRGLRVVENHFSPGDRKQVLFAAGVDVLLHRLGSLDLSRAEAVRVTLRVEETGEIIADEANAPFDREAGEIVIACQRHYAVYPPNIVFDVRVRERSGAEERATYAILHVFEG